MSTEENNLVSLFKNSYFSQLKSLNSQPKTNLELFQITHSRIAMDNYRVRSLLKLFCIKWSRFPPSEMKYCENKVARKSKNFFFRFWKIMKSVSKILTLLLYFSRPCGSNQCYNYTMVYCFDYCGKLHEEDSNECRQNEILGGANISEPIRKIGSKFLIFFAQKLKSRCSLILWFQLIVD